MCARGAATHAQEPLHNYLPPDHWGRGAVHRLATLGALDAATPLRAWPLSRAELGSLLERAREHAAARGDSATLLFAGGFLAQLRQESRPMRDRVFIRLEPGVFARSGELRAGTMEQRSDGTYRYPGPVRVSDDRGTSFHHEAAIRVNDGLTLGLEGEGGGTGRPELRAVYLHARGRHIGAWAGRRSFSFGTAPMDGLVLTGGNPFDGLGISLVEGVAVPVVGRIYADLIFARLFRSGEITYPYFHASRVVLAPRPALAIGLSRAMILGGEGNEPITPWRVFLAAIGMTDVRGKDSDFENQVASVDVSWRLPNAPVRLYAEVGADDSGRAILFVPGLILGAELGRAGGLEDIAIGAEVVHIHQHCCGYPPWYQHGALADGWTDRGSLLGHPLGGAGTQLSLSLRFDRAETIIAAGQLFARDRKPENLLAPTHGGTSFGGRVNLTIPFRPFDITVRGQGELGRAGWRSGTIHGGLAMTF